MASVVKDPTAYCSECRIQFASYMAYVGHRKRKMKAGEGHIHCDICGAEFALRETLARHVKQEHAHEQDLDCPGCGLHFTRVGGLMQHIERGQCLNICEEDIQNDRLAQTKIGRGLAKQDGKDPKGYFGRYLGIRDGVSTKPMSAVGAIQGLTNHIEYPKSGGPASSIIEPIRKAPESLNLTIGAQVSQIQRARGPDLRPGSLDMNEFPTPAEMGTCKGTLGMKAQRDGFPSTLANEKTSESVPPCKLNTTEFPTLAEAMGSKGNTEKKSKTSDTLSSFTSGGKDSKLSSSNQVKTLRDSRWAPKKPTVPSTHRGESMYDSGFSGTRDSPKVPIDVDKRNTIGAPAKSTGNIATSHPEKHQQHGSLPQTIHQAPAESEFPHSPWSVLDTKGRSPHVQEPPAERAEEAEVVSHFSSVAERDFENVILKSIPLHLQTNISREVSADGDQISISYKVPVQTLLPNLKGGLSVKLDSAHTAVSRGESDDSMVKQGDQSSVGGLRSDEKSNGESAVVPPHLRGKADKIPPPTDKEQSGDMSSDGGVILNQKEDLSHDASIDTGSAVSPPSLLTTQSTLGGAEPCGSPEPNKVSRSKESSGSSHRNAALPPHLRGKINNLDTSSSELLKPRSSPTPSMSVGDSTLEPADFESDLELEKAEETVQRPLTSDNTEVVPSILSYATVAKRGGTGGSVPSPLSRDNMGVAPSIQNYATVAKKGGGVPPHLRGKQPTNVVLSAKQDVPVHTTKGVAPLPLSSENRDDDQAAELSRALESVALKPTNTPADGVGSTMDNDEGVELGHHDPEHPLYDPLNYLSRYTGRYQCPIRYCGKAFKSMQGITGHLKSEAHKRPYLRLQCPHCMRNFNSTAALTQHSESQGRRCEIRNTTEFKEFFGQLTAGIADVVGHHEDQTNKYVVTDEAVYKYGDSAMKIIEDQYKREVEEKSGGYFDSTKCVW